MCDGEEVKWLCGGARDWADGAGSAGGSIFREARAEDWERDDGVRGFA